MRIKVSKADIRAGCDECNLYLNYRTGETLVEVPKDIEVKCNKAGQTPATKTLAELTKRVQQLVYVEPEKALFVYYHQDRGFSGSKSESIDIFDTKALKETSLKVDVLNPTTQNVLNALSLH